MEQNFNLHTIKLIIGLGNPGTRYKNTYHNAGHLFVDYLKKKYPLLIAHCSLLKSDCFMNESGSWVKKILKKYNTKPEKMLVVHDDADLAVGAYKLQFGRGAAGHKGVASIIKTLGSQAFWRLRLGIRPRIEMQRIKAEDFVLQQITQADKIILNLTFEKAITETFRDSPKNERRNGRLYPPPRLSAKAANQRPGNVRL